MAVDIEEETSASGTLLRRICGNLVLSSLTDSHPVCVQKNVGISFITWYSSASMCMAIAVGDNIYLYLLWSAPADT